jgi:hypothetical protein
MGCHGGVMAKLRSTSACNNDHDTVGGNLAVTSRIPESTVGPHEHCGDRINPRDNGQRLTGMGANACVILNRTKRDVNGPNENCRNPENRGYSELVTSAAFFP